MHLLLNRAGQDSQVVDKPDIPLTHPDTWAYMAIDTNHDGQAELMHPGYDLDTLHWTTSSDRLTETDNGRGATTRIVYKSLAGRRAYLPSGSLPTVAERVTTSDAAHSLPVTETRTWDYDGARWSDEQTRLIGLPVRAHDSRWHRPRHRQRARRRSAPPCGGVPDRRLPARHLDAVADRGPRGDRDRR